MNAHMTEPHIRLSWIRDAAGERHPYPDFIGQAEIDALLARLRVREGDVFVSTYPKSGTTWLQQICHLLANAGVQGERAIVDSVPWVEAHALPEKPSLAELEALEAPRYMQIHAPWSLAPKGRPGVARYLYAARNPKDVAVSFFHHQRAKQRDPEYSGDFAHFVEAFIAGQVPCGSWFRHVREWWTLSQTREDVLFLRYEDMIADLHGELGRIVAFLGMEIDAELHARIVEQSSFAHMKRHGLGEPKGEFRSRGGESAHLRKGKVGDWINYFSEEQAAAMDAACARELGDTQLRFEDQPR